MPFGHRLEALQCLGSRGFSDREELLRYQSRRLISLVRHAFENVPYYRRLLKGAGLDPREFRGLPDLGRIPASSKEDLLAVPAEDLVSRRFRTSRLFSRTTSGSTGRPFTVRCSFFEERYLGALRFRVLLKLGMRAGDRVAQIRYREGSPRDAKWALILDRLGLLRITHLSSSLDPADIAHRLQAIQPDVIRGYGNLTTLVADAVQRYGLSIRPRLVTVGGDTLTAGMRQRIAEAFQTPVRETFGSHEFNVLAWECGATNQLHVCEEGVVLEVLRADRPAGLGERGEVVATALHSYAQPFIRFRLGDIATRGPETCACGLPYSTIRSIDGRIYDRILLPDGRAASPGDVLAPLERDYDWLKQYQMVQQTRNLVILRLVPHREPPAEDLQDIGELMERFLGPDVQHRIDLLEEIPLGPGEKFRASISRVFSNYGGDA